MTYSVLKCFACGSEYNINRNKYTCDKCGNILDVFHYDMEYTTTKLKGVWKYKNLIHPSISNEKIITKGEGNTNLYNSSRISKYSGINNIYLKHEGENPTGSFKDRGMTVAVSEGMRLNFKKTLCASTGNTSAAAASYSAFAGIESYVMIPGKNISANKLFQAIAYGANIVDIDGDFDTAMADIKKTIEKRNDFYLLNSLNPWRIEGQKTIIYEIMEKLKPDFISFPAGNLGNTSAFGKALMDLKSLGVINEVPRLIAIQAEGAAPFYEYIKEKLENIIPVKAETIATAIKIGNPVNFKKAKRSIEFTNGIVEKVSDDQILEAKREIDRSGIGCEPASAAAVAGVKKLRESGILDRGDTVVSILTGNILKDVSIIPEYKSLKISDIL
ncbi:threonine synthase [Ferroplasma sp.]|uniref:threonine synthase n=1 Tax=Ferroplasma sp. TaxID=2591003 RepID=UPI00307D2B52